MGLSRNHREHMHKMHQEIYGRSNPWVGKAMKPEKKVTSRKEVKAAVDKKIPEKVLKKVEKPKVALLGKKADLGKTIKKLKQK